MTKICYGGVIVISDSKYLLPRHFMPLLMPSNERADDYFDAMMYASIARRLTFWQKIRFCVNRLMHNICAWMKGLGVNGG